MEEYFIRKYMPKCEATTFLQNLESFRCKNNPWTSALKDKKVLVVHPFSELISNQYNNYRNMLYHGTDILPRFDLRTVKAVQTIAGNKDSRFDTWFDALDYMVDESLKQEFDIAIIGCGAYGFPLAAELKKHGKQAFHLGGVTQTLFGIRGKRFDEAEDYSLLRNFYNEYWCHPAEGDKPQGFTNVEGGCYW
jgi:hypothetical protein